MRVFWRGTREGLMMAVPLVGLYLPLYDSLVERVAPLGIAAPMVAGAVARTVSMFFVTPIEVLRVRLQTVRNNNAIHNASHISNLSAFDWGQGKSPLQKARALWRGFGATVFRDVPFTIVYWGMMEPIRKHLSPNTEDRTLLELLFANSVAGASAGVVASVVTNPMDVVKTRMQISRNATTASSPSGMLNLLRHIYKTEGIRGLFTGVAPRTLRIGPSCAIVISTYELLKQIL